MTDENNNDCMTLTLDPNMSANIRAIMKETGYEDPLACIAYFFGYGYGLYMTQKKEESECH